MDAHRLKFHPRISAVLLLSCKWRESFHSWHMAGNCCSWHILLLFFQLFLFVLFLSLPLHYEISSPPLFFTLSTCSAPLDPDASLSFVPEAAVIELNTDYGSYLLYSCQNSCQKQWIKIKSGWIITIQAKRYHRNIFSFCWACCGIKSETPTRFIFSYPESHLLFSSCKQSKKSRWEAWSMGISSLFTRSPQQTDCRKAFFYFLNFVFTSKIKQK